MPTAAPTAPHPKLVPTTVAAAHTGLPDETIRRLVRQGLPFVRIGTKFYFDLDKVDAWIDDWFDRAAADSAAEAIADSAAEAAAARPAAADQTSDAYREHIRQLVNAAPSVTAAQAAAIKAVLAGSAA